MPATYAGQILGSSVPDPGLRRVRLIVIGLATAGLLVGLAGAGSMALAFRERVQRRAVILKLGRWSLSAELTYTPNCAPLAETCWPPHYRVDRPKYFSAWLYRTTPPNVPWDMVKWRVVTIDLGPDGYQ